MKEYLGYGNNKIICDKCNRIIGIDEDGNSDVSIKFKDLNLGHECKDCKKARERAYDRYVDPLGFYH